VKFRAWLAKKYETIDALNEVWYRYSYRDWNDVEPPRTNDPYPDSIDWALFRIDNAMRLFISWSYPNRKSTGTPPTTVRISTTARSLALTKASCSTTSSRTSSRSTRPGTQLKVLDL
jgi:beta-galactosidase GanA